MRLNTAAIALLLLLGVARPVESGPTVTFGFEGFPDSTILTNQLSGLTFSDAIILTAGISLNEFEFPPHSGANVASDNGGPMNISFAPAVQGFSGYFTYSVPLTLAAFNSSHAQVALATSKFSNNEALSGVAGSSPNELMQVNAASGISSVTITGAPGGSSFVLDDATITSATAVPAISTPLLALLGVGLAILALWKRPVDGLGVMKTILAITLLAPLGLWFSASAQPSAQTGRGQQGITRFSTDRTELTANQPTPVTLSARIDRAGLIAGSVNLIRLDASGTPTIVGQLHDDGNGIYTIRLTLNEHAAGQVRFQASAAFHGQMKRVLSGPVTLTVKAAQ